MFTSIENLLDFFEEYTAPEKGVPALYTQRIGWSADGRAAKDLSINGAPLSVGGRVFRAGWGDHAQSLLEVRLPSPAARFEAEVGIEDFLSPGTPLLTAAQCVFLVLDGHGRELARSPAMSSGDAPFHLVAELGGLDRFFLRALDEAYPDNDSAAVAMGHVAWCAPAITLADGSVLGTGDLEVRNKMKCPVSMASCTYGGFPLSLDPAALRVERLAAEPDFDRYRLEQTTPDGLLTLRCTATVYRDFPVVEWLPELLNRGDRPSEIVEGFRPLYARIPLEDYSRGYIPGPTGVMRFPCTDVALRRALGSKCAQSDFSPSTAWLRPRAPDDRHRMECDEGRSSANWLPFVGVDMTDRLGFNLGIGWTGGWYAEFRHAGTHMTVECGMPKTRFRVLPGETLRQVSVFLHHRRGLSVEEGQNQLRRFLLKHHSPRKADGSLLRTPLPLSAWGGQTTEALVKAIEDSAARKLPYDMFWVDAGWFGRDRPVAKDETLGSDWAVNVGDWRVNHAIHPAGLRPVAEAARKAGMRFLLWAEIERVSQDAPVAKEHPEWLLPLSSYAGCLLLNLGNDEARAWALEQIERLIREEGVTDYRQDFNCDPAPAWAAADAPDRVGVSEMKHIAGLYRFWDELRERHPDMLIDNCASGGRRIDFETNSRSICLYRSDILCRPWFDCSDANHVEVPSLSEWVPLHSGGSTPIEGDDYSYFSGLSTGTDAPVSPDAPPETSYGWLREVMVAGQRMSECFYGDFHLLTPDPGSHRGLYAYQCHLPGEGRGFFIAFQRGGDADDVSRVLLLRGIDPAATYEVETFRGTAERVAGAELRRRLVELPAPRMTRLVFYRKVNGG